MVGAILHIKGNSKFHFSCRSNRDHSQLPPKPTVVRMTHAHSYWDSLQADIEAHLKQTIPKKEPLVVFEPMHHLVFAAPRTTVPALCLAACELVGGQRHQAMAAASALLLLHAATYTHEHLPLTDRPRPEPEPEPRPETEPKPNSEPEPEPEPNSELESMVPHVYGPNIELLTGDGIVPFGFELLARSDDPAQGNSERILRVIIEISRAVGSERLIDAQYRKKMRSQSDGEELRHVEEKNESGLHACGAACGAVLGGGSEDEIERLRKYGFYVGMLQGILQKGSREEVEEVRNMALKELQVFKDREVDAISSFINV